MRRLAAALVLIAAPLAAQQQANTGNGGVLRVLDKINGNLTDVEIASGNSVTSGRIDIFLGECRYPAGNPNGDAWAQLTIIEAGEPEAAFRGWMIASAPALNPMDHPRYDVWVLRCTTS